MADTKFTALPAATTVALTDIVPEVDLTAGTTKKATWAQVRAALLPASLTADVTGTLPAANGGTGATSLPAGGLVGATQNVALTNKTLNAVLNTVTNLTPANDIIAQAVSALAIDWATGAVFTKTLSAGANTFTFANASSGRVIMVRLTGAASTVTWPTVKWAGGAAPTQTASGTDVYTFVHDGTSIYGSVVQAMA